MKNREENSIHTALAGANAFTTEKLDAFETSWTGLFVSAYLFQRAAAVVIIVVCCVFGYLSHLTNLSRSNQAIFHHYFAVSSEWSCVFYLLSTQHDTVFGHLFIFQCKRSKSQAQFFTRSEAVEFLFISLTLLSSTASALNNNGLERKRNFSENRFFRCSGNVC